MRVWRKSLLSMFVLFSFLRCQRYLHTTHNITHNERSTEEFHLTLFVSVSIMNDDNWPGKRGRGEREGREGGDTSYRGVRRVRARGGRRVRGRGERREGATPNIGAMQWQPATCDWWPPDVSVMLTESENFMIFHPSIPLSPSLH